MSNNVEVSSAGINQEITSNERVIQALNAEIDSLKNQVKYLEERGVSELAEHIVILEKVQEVMTTLVADNQRLKQEQLEREAKFKTREEKLYAREAECLRFRAALERKRQMAAELHENMLKEVQQIIRLIDAKIQRVGGKIEDDGKFNELMQRMEVHVVTQESIESGEVDPYEMLFEKKRTFVRL
jgi:conjugal transfer/entry exclusion protein